MDTEQKTSVHGSTGAMTSDRVKTEQLQASDSILGKRPIGQQANDKKKQKTEDILRVGVVKRIMALDYEGEDVKASQEAISCVSRCVALFMQNFIEKVLINNTSIVKNEKKNIVKYAQLVLTSRKHKEFKFLYDLLPEI